MQKESFFFRKFCITLRNETEWTELVENGYNCLTGSNEALLLSKFEENVNKVFGKQLPLYGEGNAANKIVSVLSSLT
jgi:UDP-GlcNAc3NAcA epimerase